MVARAKSEFGNPYMTKDMMHIILKLKLLYRIQSGRVHSYALIKEFESSPHIMDFISKHGGSVKSSIYNTVNALEKSGYVKTSADKDGSRSKKYYTITSEGRKALKESKGLFIKSMRELTSIIR